MSHFFDSFYSFYHISLRTSRRSWAGLKPFPPFFYNITCYLTWILHLGMHHFIISDITSLVNKSLGRSIELDIDHLYIKFLGIYLCIFEHVPWCTSIFGCIWSTLVFVYFLLSFSYESSFRFIFSFLVLI